MQTLYVYNGIYYAWERKKPVPPNAGIGIQSLLGMLNFINLSDLR